MPQLMPQLTGLAAARACHTTFGKSG